MAVAEPVLFNWQNVLDVTCMCLPGWKRAAEIATPLRRRLLDQFKLGSIVGQGAFGVVYLCEHRQTKKQFAVKMVDQVETPLPEIKREVEMLAKLDHPTVTKLVDTYFEKVFVCMVMHYYKGGDMMKGMSRHWVSKGMIAIPAVKRLVKQMWNAIVWIHQNSCVHRDVKGDNFMMDMPAVEDPENRIYLADFGTVLEVIPGSRLTYKCGTKQYWCPEFYNLDYSFAVDIWAVGVVTFGLFSGKFPFKNESEVKNKAPQIPKRIPADGHDMLKIVVEKEEAKRATAQDALRHPFITDLPASGSNLSLSTDVVGHTTSSAPFKPEMKESGADAGVMERRAMLVKRLQKAHDITGRGSVKHQVFGKDVRRYTVEDIRSKRILTYEWQAETMTREMSVKQDRATKTQNPMESNLSPENFQRVLEHGQITVDSFGRGSARSFNEYLQEVRDGRSLLLTDASRYKSLVRTVPITLLKMELVTDSQSFFLLEMCSNGKLLFPGTKTHAWETSKQTAERLKNCLGPLRGCAVEMDFSNIARIEVDQPSASFPNMRTIYQKDIVTGRFICKDNEILKRLGVMVDAGPAFTIEGLEDFPQSFVWLSDEEVIQRGITIGQPVEYSSLVYPPVGYQEEELNQFLTDGGVPLQLWGQGNNKSLSEFSEELVKGESTLRKQRDGKLVREVEVILLKIVRETADGSREILLEVGEECQGASAKRSRLPGVKKLAGEHHFWAARRLTSLMRLHKDMVIIDAMSVRTVEETEQSTSYYGIDTHYRKTYIEATFVEQINNH